MDAYMSAHRQDVGIGELKANFESVVDKKKSDKISHIKSRCVIIPSVNRKYYPHSRRNDCCTENLLAGWDVDNKVRENLNDADND